MAKKQKSKARLDKFYYMAKEHGFRSRAAFKLIQLNKKYDFLTNAKCVVDLCAAPGGWLQVAAKYMPNASIKIGVDLVPIKPVKGCVTFTGDITTQKCLAQIKKELKHFKADVVMNDGAPNVGAEWTKDAYNQAELCLAAVKLATEVLRRGGTFVTKVFRSQDYNSLLFVLNQLFTKVEATKPPASRSQSAEIFVVCQGYKAPDILDPKFLDPKYAFADLGEDNEAESSNKINSLKKLVESKKRNRSGYANENAYQETSFMDFIHCSDPYEYLSTYNKFSFDEEAKALVAANPAKGESLEEICQDLKVLGKREMGILLTYRYKHNTKISKARKDEKEKALGDALAERGQVELTEAELEAQNEKELEETIKRVEKERKKQEKKEKERKVKGDLRQKMSVIASSDLHNNNDDVIFDKRTFEKLQEVDIEDLDYENSEEDDDQDAIDLNNDMAMNGRRFTQNDKYLHKLKESKEEDGSDDDSEGEDDDSEDEQARRVDAMADDIDAFYSQRKDYKMELDRKVAKKEKRKKALIEQQRLKRIDQEEEDELNNDDIREAKKVKFGEDVKGGDLDDSDDSDDDYDDIEEMEVDGDDDGEAEDAEMNNENGEKVSKKKSAAPSLFINPLLVNQDNKKKRKQKLDEDDVSEGEWSQDEQDEKRNQEEKTKKSDDKKRLLGKRLNRDVNATDKEKLKDFFYNDGFEEVPQEKMDGYSSMDSDDMANTRAIAKIMLRKKARREILDSTYNRYNNFDDPSLLPQWFLEDEQKHYKPSVPITKEQAQEEKRLLKEYNERPSKKVMEAKHRKKRRLGKAMEKIKKKATIIADQDINEGSKMRQIQKLYKKENSKHKEEKSYVVNRSFNGMKGKYNAPRGTKLVDSRMKKDLKKDRARARKEKHKGKGGRGGKGGKKGGKK